MQKQIISGVSSVLLKGVPTFIRLTLDAWSSNDRYFTPKKIYTEDLYIVQCIKRVLKVYFASLFTHLKHSNIETINRFLPL
jgi:hypothetical protein